MSAARGASKWGMKSTFAGEAAFNPNSPPLPACRRTQSPVDCTSSERDGEISGPLRDLLLTVWPVVLPPSSFGITTRSSCMK